MRLVLSLAVLALPMAAVAQDYGHMSGYGHEFGFMFGPVLWLVVLGLTIAGVIWLVRRLDGQSPQQKSSNAIAELDMRFARGEIDAEDYTARKKLLVS